MMFLRVLFLLALVFASVPSRADVDITSKFSNQGSVANTRHNMTQRQSSGGGPSAAIMDPYRNDYQEVCVYCHTPHAANTTVALPLWNRTIKVTTYTTYEQLGTSTLTQSVSQPGPNSLACLSCHDGQTAVDSIVNMPGSGGYSAAQMTAQNNSFLNTWTNTRGPDASVHLGMSAPDNTGCLACHSPDAGFVGAGATDFRAFRIGTDLTNDHPVGVTFPTNNGPGTDFNTPGGTKGSTKFYDRNGNNHMDKDEIRLYDSGAGPKVECASCHDPHGVSPGGGAFNPTFLRVSNTGSAVCMTCHSK
ncbi:cytochrome c3 family protein [Denitratisoma oestradiolicum]|uniref:Doubled CXXCH motif-containing protein n=1 Tax=Denitratisoma oestradiolicum TaxID=311182 RepID=A0A6S6YRG9_9PROT|nr:cytochrome c3 family protein [Denitratisoma oestradiolicum]TWO79320.1 hypothetical protein CBW56_15540 [Denitratisoma oestradiolicum]CAB1370352.1 Doubled CXXCH motif-containing protein [Denitratisoma oestradiolicum]